MIKALILSALLGLAATSAYAEDKSANAVPAEVKPDAANRKLVRSVLPKDLQALWPAPAK
jgi:hypothetical protein